MGFKVAELATDVVDSPLKGVNFTKKYSLEHLLSRLESRDTKDVIMDTDIRSIIRDNFDLIFDYDLFFNDPNTREIGLKLFTNSRFILNLISVLDGLDLTGYQLYICNKIAYDYIQENGLDNIIAEQLFYMTKVVNRNLILKIDALLPEGYSAFISIIRRSSLDEKLNIRRLNNFLINSGFKWSPAVLIELYSRLFDHMSTLFNQTMFESLPSSYTELQLTNYNSITITMISILDNMTSVEMKKLLESYVAYCEIVNMIPRYSLKKLDKSYTRIHAVIDELAVNDIIVP